MDQPTEPVEPLALLSERERLVATKSAEGLTYREIAEVLVIAPNTVRTHLSAIYKKLGIRNKAALIHLLSNGQANESNTRSQRDSQPPPACPYPGMVPFRAEDAVYFYGRETEIEQMLQHLRQQRFLMVIGPSGSGKSSLVYAGLLPQLAKSHYFEEGHWLVRLMRPGSHPICRLAQLLETKGEDDVVTNDTIQQVLDHCPPAQSLLVLIDQFEEVFTQAGRDERNCFLTALQTLRSLPNCTLLLTMRADFYPDLMISPLWPVGASQRVEIAPLQGDALRAAIEKPATAVGVRIEESLISRLLVDAADEPGVLPLLQETMGQLWLQMEQRVLSYSAYEKLCGHDSLVSDGRIVNGLAIAIAMKADTTLTKLTLNQQLIARRIFLRLIQFGEGRADTRRQQQMSALQAVGDDLNEFDRTLEHLTDHRLLTRSGDDEEDDSRVDISHESLITGWARLHDWIEERREAEQIRRRLEIRAAEWVRLGLGSGGLLDDEQLPEAERWLASPDADDLGYSQALPKLVEASQQAIAEAEQAREANRRRELTQAQALANEQRRAASRMKRSMIGLAAVMLIAVAAGIFAWLQSQQAQQAEQEAKRLVEAEMLARTQSEARRVEAEEARAEAEAQRVEAENARLASIAQLLLMEAPQQQATQLDERGALLARQAYLFSIAGDRRLRGQVDGVLRTMTGKPQFSSILDQLFAPAVAFSPDGTRLASMRGAPYHDFAMWDITQPGTPPIVLPDFPGGPSEYPFPLTFSPDGKTLLTADAKGTLGWWQLDAPHMPFTELPKQKGGIWSAVFSPDGRWLATGSKLDDNFSVWDLAQPNIEPILIFDPQPAPDGSGSPSPKLDGVPVAFSPDSALLATGSLNGIIRLWRLDDLTVPVTSLRGHEGGLLALVFYDQGRRLASSGQDNTIRLWDLESPSVNPAVLENGTNAAVSLAFDPNDRLLASASFSDGIRLWQIDALNVSPILLPGNYFKVVFSPVDRFLASAGTAQSYLRLWDLRSSARPQVITDHQDYIYSLAFSSDGKRLASGGGSVDKTIRLWRWNALDEPPVVLRDQGNINSLDFNNDDSRLLSSSWSDSSVRLWKLNQPTPTATVLPIPDSLSPWTALFNPDGKMLVTTGNGGIHAWGIAHLDIEPKVLMSNDYWPTEIAFSPSGDKLVMASFSAPIYLQDLSNPEQPVSVLHGHSESGAWSVVFSPDGQTLASGGRVDASVRLWNPNAPEQPSLILGHHDGAVIRVRFSPDGKQLASVSMDRSVRLWSVDNPDMLPIVLSDHEGEVWALAYSPDGKQLVTGGTDKTIRIWDLTHPLNSSTTQQVADMVCEKVWRNLTLDEWHKFVGVDIPYERTCENRPIHTSLFEAAEKLAKEGDKENALALLERAVELDSGLDLNPQQEVERWGKNRIRE